MSAKRKVLLVANNFPPVRGGSAVVYANIADKLGDRIVIIAPRNSYFDGLPLIGWREHDRLARYPVIRVRLLRTVMTGQRRFGIISRVRLLASDLFIRVRLTGTIIRILATEQVVALCIGELLASGWILPLFRRWPGLRLLVYVHGEEITTEETYDALMTRRRRALMSADDIIVVSRFTSDAVLDLLGSSEGSRIRIIANGVDATRFQPRQKRPDLMALYQLDGAFVFVVVCRLLEKKGVDNAIRALAKVVRDYPDCRYLVVGTGPFREQLKAIALAEGVANKVIFAGDVPEYDLVDHYCLGDAFVMPNHALANGDTEGFGLVFLEANCCGLPVIAGKDGGSTDAVQNDVNGLVVDGNSVAEIAKAMQRLREDPELCGRLSKCGREIAAASDWRFKAEAFYEACAGHRAD